jgi:hypothetical protein
VWFPLPPRRSPPFLPAARAAGTDVDPGPGLGLEDLGTRIQHVSSLARSSPPGFGWDPYVLDNE